MNIVSGQISLTIGKRSSFLFPPFFDYWWEDETAGQIYWHLGYYHLYDIMYAPVKSVIAYYKMVCFDHLVGTRIKLLKPMVDVPLEMQEARKQAVVAQEARDRTHPEELKHIDLLHAAVDANVKFTQIARHYKTEIDILHAQQCPDCLWDRNKKEFLPFRR